MTVVTKNENFSNSRRQMPPIAKSFFGHNSLAELSDFSEILHGKSEQHRSPDINFKFQKFKMADAHILKIIKSSTKKSPDFDEIWYTTADLELDESCVTK